jgi:hypothetical protein
MTTPPPQPRIFNGHAGLETGVQLRNDPPAESNSHSLILKSPHFEP